jgi:hypothetical protein
MTSRPIGDRYGAITKRTYRQAVEHLLESEYKIVGSRRVIECLAEDMETLNREYFGETTRLSPGIICWRTQALGDRKVTYAKRAEDYLAKTIYLPLVTPGDVEKRSTHKKGVRNDNYQVADKREVEQMVRLLWSAYHQGVSLTIGELSVLMNRSIHVIGKYIKQYYSQHPEETLPLRGYIMDQGSNPTHKGLIVTLYERGVSEPEIARQTVHRDKSVAHYINHYRRVKQLLERKVSTDDIARIIGIARRVVLEYERIATHFHPKLARPKTTLRKTKKPLKTHRGHLAP